MFCYRQRSFNYGLIRVMFWAFPYLLWQAFGNPSGFVVGVIVALVLTTMFTNLLRRERTSPTPVVPPQQLSIDEPHTSSHEEYRPYTSGYQAETVTYHAEEPLYHVEKLQAQYEEMQISYPQEIPPMKQQ